VAAWAKLHAIVTPATKANGSDFMGRLLKGSDFIGRLLKGSDFMGRLLKGSDFMGRLILALNTLPVCRPCLKPSLARNA